jgi:putative transposase
LRSEPGHFHALEWRYRHGRKGKPTEEILESLCEVAGRIARGKTISKIWRSFAISERTYYKWRLEYGGLKIDQAIQLKDLERENERLKKAASELTLDKQISKLALSRGERSFQRPRVRHPPTNSMGSSPG